MASDILPPSESKGRIREKVALKAGFHLTDWMRLCQSGQNLSGRKDSSLRKIHLAELQEHKSKFDCWTAHNGKIYNITQYLDFHPGGVTILMQAAGKDCTALFDKYHKWVNIESLLSKCLIGYLIEDEETAKKDSDVDVTPDSGIIEDIEQSQVLAKATALLLLENEDSDEDKLDTTT
eukprot:gene11680-24463_t